MKETKINTLIYYICIIYWQVKLPKNQINVQHVKEENATEYIKENLFKYSCMFFCGYEASLKKVNFPYDNL